LLTKEILPDLPSHISQEPIYTSSNLNLGYLQKLKLLKLVKIKNRFDIIHYMLTPTRLSTFLFKTFLKSKRAKTIQTIATLREDLFSDQTLKKLFFADSIITYSDYAKNKLVSLGFQNVVRIYPGIDLEKYSFAPKHLATLSMFGIKESDFTIVYPGEYVRLGATDLLVDIIPSLISKIPNLKFIFACRIKNSEDLKKKDDVVLKLTEMGIIDRAVFTDTFSDMPKLYNLADIVVFPVKNMEGKFDVPLAVIEAMACEKPVIISDLPILQEFTNEENCATIPNNSAEKLVEKIAELYADPDERTRLGRNARKFAEENFDINSVAAQYRVVYEKL